MHIACILAIIRGILLKRFEVLLDKLLFLFDFHADLFKNIYENSQ